MKRITWYTDNRSEWLGWSEEKNMRVDEPDFLVRQVDDVWAGWAYAEDGSRTCVTHDYPTAADARLACMKETRCGS